MKLFNKFALASCLALGGLGVVQAQTIIPQSALISSTTYYTDSLANTSRGTVSLPRCDDCFSSAMPLGFSLTFFGQTYTSYYLNNNGNITFTGGLSAFVPTGPVGANQPIISPFFTDVDTRTGSGTVSVRSDIANELIITWDGVGRFNQRATPTDSFQLVLRGAGFPIPNGEGAIGFFYKDMGYDSTDTNQVSAIGFGDGAGQGEVLQGSLFPGLAAAVANSHIWFDANLVVVPPDGPPTGVPEPESIALLGLGLVGLGLARRRRQA